jgi:hypothetical protein
VHFDLAKEMVVAALEQIGCVLFGMGVFASCRFLPYQMFAAAVWCLAAGLACLAFGDEQRALPLWMLGLGFWIGQLAPTQMETG